MDTQLVQITDLVKDYAKIIDDLRENNKLLLKRNQNLAETVKKLEEKNDELSKTSVYKDSSFWKQREELKEENKVLRQALSDIAANLGNGSTVSVDASLPFIKELPHEVKLVCDGLRKALLAEQKTCNTLRDELKTPPTPKLVKDVNKYFLSEVITAAKCTPNSYFREKTWLAGKFIKWDSDEQRFVHVFEYPTINKDYAVSFAGSNFNTASYELWLEK